MIIKLKDFVKTKIKKIFIKIFEKELFQIKEYESKIQAIEQYVFYQNTHFIDGDLIIGENSYIEPSAKVEIKITNNLELEGDNYVGRYAELQPSFHIKLGFGTSIQDRNIILGDVEIGRFCLTAPNVYMSSFTHYYNKVPHHYIKNQDYFMFKNGEDKSRHSKKIIIEDDVWIGINSVIMSGVKISKGAVIGSNSVVTKDILPYEVVSGAPAKKIKNRIDFTPKPTISYFNEKDLPYFYSGFMLDYKNLELSSSLKGYFACNKFSICLAKENDVKSIKIRIKLYVSYSVEIRHNHQVQKIDSNEYLSLSFETVKTDGIYCFEILNHSEKYVPLVVVESVILD